MFSHLCRPLSRERVGTHFATGTSQPIQKSTRRLLSQGLRTPSLAYPLTRSRVYIVFVHSNRLPSSQALHNPQEGSPLPGHLLLNRRRGVPCRQPSLPYPIPIGGPHCAPPCAPSLQGGTSHSGLSRPGVYSSVCPIYGRLGGILVIF